MKTKSITKGNPVNPTFDFWIENKMANKRTFFISDVKLLFRKWLVRQNKEWVINLDAEMAIRFFLTSKDGMNAAFEEGDISELHRYMKKDFYEVIK